MSSAGARAGLKDGTRSGLWSYMADAINTLRPSIVIIENVRGLLSARAHRAVESDDAVVGDRSDRPVLRAAGAVLGDLSDIGYDAVWTTLAAASVGAPHRRERVFILATDADQVRSEGSGLPNGMGETLSQSGSGIATLPGNAPHPPSDGRHRRPGDELPIGAGDLRRVSGKSTTAIGDGSGLSTANSGDEPGLALLPTPVAHDGKGNGPSGYNRRTPDLQCIDYYLPTPSLSDTKTPRRGAHLTDTLENNTHTINLSDAIEYQHGRDALLCTPAAQDGNGGMDLRTTVTLLPTPTCEPQTENGHARNLGNGVKPAQWGKYAPAIQRWEHVTGTPAPAPTEPNKNGNPRLSAALSEWLMGWPAGWVTDPNIGISRNDQLRIVGNGVCCQQAIAALRYLLSVTQELEFA